VEFAIAQTAAAPLATDAEAFEALYRQQAPRIFALASRIAGSRDQGEDLLQEIFLQAYRKMGSFKGEAAIGTWLYRLAINHCLDYVRSRDARMGRLTDTLDVAACPTTRLALDRAIAQLPDGCRAIFVLHDIEGFDHKEIARMMGIAEGTSKSQVFKARMKLRALLNESKESES
jgi:RNA polymerase sigma-70 factor (ECF subfamily)